MRVLHLITTLDTGGAEMMLYKLLSHHQTQKVSPMVVSLGPPGTIGAQIEKLGIRVAHLGLGPNTARPSAVLKLIRLIRENRPHIIQSWMYHSDLMALLAAKLSNGGKIVWNIRGSQRKLSHFKPMTMMIMSLCALLSRFPDAVVVNSISGRRFHQSIGYRPKRFVTIKNGFNMDRLRPNVSAGKQLRKEWGFNNETFCVALIARYRPVKGHDTFLKAAKLIIQKGYPIKFILCGDGITYHNQALSGFICELALQDHVLLLGHREDVPQVLNAVDALVSASYSEGFSNVLGEAMACAVPCVVSDVGDSAYIVNSTGKIVPPNNSSAMAEAIIELFSMPADQRRKLGEKARQRISDHFSLDKIVDEYYRLYSGLIN